MKKTKKILAGLLAVVMLLGMLPTVAFAAGSATMDVTTNGTSITQLKGGDIVTVKIGLPTMSALAGAELWLEFDKALLSFTPDFDEDEGIDVVDSALPASWGPTQTSKANANTAGRVQFNAGGTANKGNVTAGFNLLTLKFTVKEGVSGSAQFTLSKFNLRYLVGTTSTPVSDVTTPAAVSITVPKAPLASASASVDVPSKNTDLDTTVTVGSAAYTGTVEWFKGASAVGTAVTGKAVGGQQYTARITLTPDTAAGENFAASVAVTGSYTGTVVPNAQGKLIITKTFDATESRILTGITITNEPSKKDYVAGESFSAAGMVVTASYDDDTTAPVTGYTVAPSGTLTTDVSTIVVTYLENGVTQTANQTITVEPNTLTGIAVSGTFKKAYTIGDSADWTGMVVTATYRRGNTAQVTGIVSGFDSSAYAASQTITVSYTAGGVTKTDTFAISVDKKTLTTADISTGWPVAAAYDGTEKTYTASFLGGITTEQAGVITVTYNGSSTKPVDAGNYTVVVSVAGGTLYKAAASLKTEQVAIGQATPTLNAADVSVVINTDKAVGATVTGAGAAPDATKITYSVVSGGEYIELNPATGVITGKAEGTAQVKVSYAGEKNYKATYKDITVTVTTKRPVTVTFAATGTGSKDFDNTEVGVGTLFTDATYTGNTMAGTVKYWYNGTAYGTLAEVSTAAKAKNANTYTVKAVFENNEEYGEKAATFTINQASQTTVLTLATVTVKFGETLTLSAGGGDGTGAYSYSIPTGGTGSATISGTVLTPTKVGTVQVKVTRAASTNYKAVDKDFTITITEGTAPTLTPTNYTGRYTKSGEKSVALPTGMPANAGNVVYTATILADTNSILSGVSVANGQVKFTIAAGKAAGNTATIRVKAESDNYADATVDVTVTLTDKDDQAVLTLSNNNYVTFGNDLALTTSGGSGEGLVTFTIVNGTGTATLDTTGKILKTTQGGTVTVTAHKAGDDDYNAADSAPVVITIRRAVPTGKPGYTPLTAAKKTLGDANLVLGTISVPGVVTWNDGATTEAKANVAYDWTFTPAEPLNYEGLTGKITPYVYMPSETQPAIYPITLPTGIQNGTITASAASSKAGEVITLTVTPNNGYVLGGLSVKDAMGKDIPMSQTGSGVYSFTMPISSVYVTASFVKDSKPFADVSENDWFNGAVVYVYEKKLMNGIGGGLFDPNGNVTRGMLMTVLARMAGTDTTASSPWYAIGMEWAKQKGVSDGTEPEKAITREQVATMLYRYMGQPAVGGDYLKNIPDGGKVSTWAVDAMNWAVVTGLMKGDQAGNLNPQGTATRAEVATMLMRFVETVLK